MVDKIVMSLQQGTNSVFVHTSINGSTAERMIDISSRPIRIAYIVRASDMYYSSAVALPSYIRYMPLDPAVVTPFGKGYGYFGCRYLQNGSFYCEYVFLAVKAGVVELTSAFDRTSSPFWGFFMKAGSTSYYTFSLSFDITRRFCLWLPGYSGSYTANYQVLTDVQASAVLDWLKHILCLEPGCISSS